MGRKVEKDQIFINSKGNLVKIFRRPFQREVVLGYKNWDKICNKTILISYNCLTFLYPETGKYVAIDLSGKNLRILMLTLYGKGKDPTVHTNNFVVPNPIMKGSGEQVECAKNLYSLQYNTI